MHKESKLRIVPDHASPKVVRKLATEFAKRNDSMDGGYFAQFESLQGHADSSNYGNGFCWASWIGCQVRIPFAQPWNVSRSQGGCSNFQGSDEPSNSMNYHEYKTAGEFINCRLRSYGNRPGIDSGSMNKLPTSRVRDGRSFLEGRSELLPGHAACMNVRLRRADHHTVVHFDRIDIRHLCKDQLRAPFFPKQSQEMTRKQNVALFLIGAHPFS